VAHGAQVLDEAHHLGSQGLLLGERHCQGGHAALALQMTHHLALDLEGLPGAGMGQGEAHGLPHRRRRDPFEGDQHAGGGEIAGAHREVGVGGGQDAHHPGRQAPGAAALAHPPGGLGLRRAPRQGLQAPAHLGHLGEKLHGDPRGAPRPRQILAHDRDHLAGEALPGVAKGEIELDLDLLAQLEGPARGDEEPSLGQVGLELLPEGLEGLEAHP